jgi:glucose-1-phosphate cytidylyltransferase
LEYKLKVVILAGGLGSRLTNSVDSVPKPMVTIGQLPIICHIMNIYSLYGYNEFIFALGHKAEMIKEYFINYCYLANDFKLDIASNQTKIISGTNPKWNISFINTGEETQTGGRILRLKSILKGEDFMLTYGDGLADVNINNLVNFHNKSSNLVTVTAVRPAARFGELVIDSKNKVNSFKEKPQINNGWVNGGFFVMNNNFLNYIDGDNTVLEKDPLEKLVLDKKLGAFKHEGFWQCMDTIRDRDYLNSLFNSNKAPWIK